MKNKSRSETMEIPNQIKGKNNAINEIFDIVNMILFKKFPRIKTLAREYEFINEWGEYLPNTMKIIKEKSIENK